MKLYQYIFTYKNVMHEKISHAVDLPWKKIAIVEIITRKITDMQKNAHGKKLTIFFTQIVN